MPERNPRYRGVILDIDGTLVDSNGAHVEAWVSAFMENNFNVSPEKVRRLIGMGGDNLIPKAIGIEKESAAGRAVARRHGELFKERLPRLKAFPRVRDLLQRMRDDGLKLVVATSAESDEMEGLLEIAGVADLLADTTSKGDAESSKPDPDIVHAALGRLGVPAGQSLMLGDTPYDVEAAGKLGVGTIALRCGGFTDGDLAAAVALYDDPADLLAHYDDSPLGA